MDRGFRLAAALGAPVLLGAAPAPVGYLLTPEFRAGRLDHLAVEMQLPGDLDGVTDVRLPDRWAGEAELHRHLSAFTAAGGKLSRPAPGLLRLTHGPGAPLTLKYEVRNGRGSGSGADYRPDIAADGYTVLGEAVFAWPVGRLSGAARARVADGAPGWSAASDLPRASTVDAVLESVAVAGQDVRVETRGAGPDALTVAVRGKLGFTAEAAADRLARILRAQRARRQGPDGPFLAVLQALPADPERFTRDGMGRGDAAVYFLSPDEPLHLSDRILAHEPVHDWLPRKVGGLPGGASEPAGYWFSEGFSDFVALRSLAGAGLTDLPGYAADLDLRLDADGTGPAVTNAEIVAGYGRRRELFQLPYRRGLGLAVLWDSQLREATAGRVGVDDVLSAMRVRASVNPAGPTADVLFPQVYRQLGGPDLSADIAAHVRDGRPIQWPAALYGGCLQIQSGPAWTLDAQLNEVPGGRRRSFVVKRGLPAAEQARCRRWLIGG